MATRTITQCDRCRVEITPATAAQEPRQTATREGEALDLCGSCTSKLGTFLDGRELEIPP